MTKDLYPIIVCILISTLGFTQQPLNEANVLPKTEKARYLSGNLEKELAKNIKYPINAAASKINGEVTLEVTISKTGTANEFKVIKQSNNFFTIEALRTSNNLKAKWKPAIENGEAVDKTYLLVFQFMMADFDPIKYCISRVEKLLEKQKYDRALKLCNTTIEEWTYEPDLYQLRAKIYALLKNVEASTSDQIHSMEIRDKFICDIILVKAYSVKQPARIIGGEVRKVNY